VVEPGEGSGAGFGAHPAAQDDRVMSCGAQCVGEAVEVGGPLGEHEAVPAPWPGPRARRR
jgi:hypothetical protein